MDYSHLNGKTLFYAAPANTHEHGRPTFRRAEKYGRLMVSGNVVGLEPVDDDSGWWIEISPEVIAKLRQNKEARSLTYLGRVIPKRNPPTDAPRQSSDAAEVLKRPAQ